MQNEESSEELEQEEPLMPELDISNSSGVSFFKNTSTSSSSENQTNTNNNKPTDKEEETKSAQPYVIFRGFRFHYLQKVSQFIPNVQCAAFCYIDSTMPDFEYQLEKLFILKEKCPEIYVILVLRGVLNDLYLK